MSTAEFDESLVRFRKKFPDRSRMAFIAMEFGKSVAHEEML